MDAYFVDKDMDEWRNELLALKENHSDCYGVDDIFVPDTKDWDLLQNDQKSLLARLLLSCEIKLMNCIRKRGGIIINK